MSYNVKDYGLIGDNITIDTTALNALIESVSDNSVIYFPAGVYLLNGFAPVLTKRLSFIGEDKNSVTLVGPGRIATQRPISLNNLTFSGWTNVVTFNTPVEGIDGVSITNCLAIGGGSLTAIGYGYYDNVIKNILISDCEIKDGSNGIWLQGLIHNVTIRNCRVTNLTYIKSLSAMWLGKTGSSLITVSNNYIDGIFCTGTTAECHGIIVFGDDVIISENNVRNMTTNNSQDCEGIYHKGTRTKVINNILYNACNHGAGSIASKGYYTNGHNEYSGNYIYSLDTGYAIFTDDGYSSVHNNIIIQPNGFGIQMYDCHAPISCCYNIITCKGAGMYLFGTTSDARTFGDIICIGNRVEISETTYCLRVVSGGTPSSNVTISGNQFIAPKGGGVHINSGNIIRIFGNIIYYGCSTGVWHGISAGMPSVTGDVTDNTIKKTTDGYYAPIEVHALYNVKQNTYISFTGVVTRDP